MANKAVFLDRDNTVIEDPGYLADPSAVKLLPGVELAIKSMAQAGYRIAVVTNQSGIARGLLTEEALEKIHAELRRQLAAHGAHLDAIYHCPYHPEGTVEEYARDSDLRKPQPGMLLQAAKELDLDLSSSWMVGDSGRDIEAGQRAGCRTVRVRTRPSPHATPGEMEDEDVQADYTVRNLVDAARVILRSPKRAAEAVAAAEAEPSARAKTVHLMAQNRPVASVVGGAGPLGPPEDAAEADAPAAGPAKPEADSAVRMEILRHVRQLARAEHVEEFSFVKLFAGIMQVLALLALLIVFVKMLGDRLTEAMLWALICIAMQLMSLTLFFGVKRK
ncbi:MAG TPA: HAD family hydrolase [Phycisphaerae bacterium]|nr:HAD family hydrolase [Phycisphaerae bacterium]